MNSNPNAPEVDVLKRMQYQAAQFRVDSGNFDEAGLISQTAEDRRLVDSISGGLETAFAALIAKQDALVAERDALAAEVGALREALRMYIRAGFGNSTDFCDQALAYDAAVRALDTNKARAEAGHGLPPVG